MADLKEQVKNKILNTKDRITQFVAQNPTPNGLLLKTAVKAPVKALKANLKYHQKAIEDYSYRNPNQAAQVLKVAEPIQRRAVQFGLQPYQVKLKSAQIDPQAHFLYKLPRMAYNNIVKPVAESTINAPAEYIGGITETGLNLGKMANDEKVRPQDLLHGVGRTGKAIYDMSLVLGVGKLGARAAHESLKRGFIDTVQIGAQKGGEFGAGYGLMSGFMNQKDVEDLMEYASLVSKDATLGGVGGSVFGGGVSAVGYGAGKLWGSIVNRIKQKAPSKPNVQVEKEAMEVVRVELKKAKVSKSTVNPRMNDGGDDYILPKEFSLYEESKKVGAKRISPDRVPHQQLIPDEGIRALVNKQKQKLESNANSWLSASEKIGELKVKYGESLPIRTEQNIQKYPSLLDDYRLYSHLKKYAWQARSLSDIQNQFLERGGKIKSQWTREMETKALESAKKEYIDLIKKDISKGYKFPETVLNYDKSFRTALDNRARYEKGLFTSFSADDQRIVFDEKNRIVSGMKRQDGKELLPQQKKEIIDGVIQTQNALGIDLNKLSKDERWVYAHLNGKNPFLTQNAAGLYRRGDGYVSVSLGGTEGFESMINGVKIRQKVNTTVAHEIGHALDHNQKGELFSSQTYWKLRDTFKPTPSYGRGDKYWKSKSEVTARALEQYVAIKEGLKDKFNSEGYWDENTFNTIIKPEIEKTIGSRFSQYKQVIGAIANKADDAITTSNLDDQALQQAGIISKPPIPEGNLRKFAQTVTEGPISDQTKQKILSDPDLYFDPLKNKDVMDRAFSLIKKSESKAYEFARNGTDTDANATALALIDKYLKGGKEEQALQLLDDVAPRFTKQGQEIQILSQYAKLTPVGATKFLQNLVAKVNKERGPGQQIKLTKEVIKRVTVLAERAQQAPEGRQKVIAAALLLREIKEQVPVSLARKLSSLQTINLLLNPKTLIRNIGGNTALFSAENMANTTGSFVDRVVSLFTGKRTLMTPSLGVQMRGMKQGAKYAIEDTMLGIDTGYTADKYMPVGRTFQSAPMRALEKVLNFGLRVPDKAAFQGAYMESLNNQMRAAGTNKPTPEMLSRAFAEGQYRIFQGDSGISKFLVGLKKLLNKPTGGEFGLGDFVIKYPGIPGNIVQVGLDYSPAGFLKSVGQIVSHTLGRSTFDQRAFSQNMGRAIVGTGTLTTGMILAKLGLITGKNADDGEVAATDRETGWGGYGINLSALQRWYVSGFDMEAAKAITGDLITNYDWVQPNALAFTIGANMVLSGDKSGTDKATSAINMALGSLDVAIEGVTQQPVFSSPKRFLANVGRKGQMVRTLVETALDVPATFIPTVSKQTGQYTGPNINRETYDPNILKQGVNKVLERIPIARDTLEPKISVFGEETPTFKTGNSFFNVFLNPSFLSRYIDKPEAQLVVDIFRRSGETQQAPRFADKKIKMNGSERMLQPGELTAYQKYIGSRTQDVFKDLAGDKDFNDLEDDKKAKIMAGVLTDINADAKKYLFGKSGLFPNEGKVSYTVSPDAPQGVIDRLDLYARGIFVDPSNTIKAIFTQERLRKISGDAAIFERKQFLNDSGIAGTQMDHIIPLSLGGDNSESNLILQSGDVAEEKDRLEKKLARELQAGTIKKVEAQRQIREWMEQNPVGAITQPTADKMSVYTEAQEESESKQLESVTRETLKYSDKSYLEANGKIYFKKESPSGISITTIDPSFTPQYPKFTGEDELDKNLKSKYSSQITKKSNDIMTMYEHGLLTAQEANSQLQALKIKKDKAKVKKGRRLSNKKYKLKKFKALAYKKIKFKKVKLLNAKDLQQRIGGEVKRSYV